MAQRWGFTYSMLILLWELLLVEYLWLRTLVSGHQDNNTPHSYINWLSEQHIAVCMGRI